MHYTLITQDGDARRGTITLPNRHHVQNPVIKPEGTHGTEKCLAPH